jgi:hypothetical protein
MATTSQHAASPTHSGQTPRSPPRVLQTPPALSQHGPSASCIPPSPESSPKKLDWVTIDDEDGAYALLKTATPGSTSDGDTCGANCWERGPAELLNGGLKCQRPSSKDPFLKPSPTFYAKQDQGANQAQVRRGGA